jgi:hypothetical protein
MIMNLHFPGGISIVIMMTSVIALGSEFISVMGHIPVTIYIHLGIGLSIGTAWII